MSVNENRHSEEGFTAQEHEAYADEILRGQVEESKDFFFPHPRDYYGPLGIFEDFEFMDSTTHRLCPQCNNDFPDRNGVCHTCQTKVI